MREVALSDTKGKVRFIATFASLRSGECAYVNGLVGDEANERLKVLYYIVTVDPPSLQARYCSEETGKVHPLSDLRDQSFGRSYGVLVSGSKLLAPAVFVVDADDIVRYARYFDSMDWLPEYGEALAALKEALEDCSRD
jgi:thiol peroxidase